MTVKRIVPETPINTISVDASLVEAAWIGYRTNGGAICLLTSIGGKLYGFVSRNNDPVFTGGTKAACIRAAINAGRKVIHATTLGELQDAV